MHSVCLYAYYEKDDTCKKNLEYFINHGLNEHSDFIFIINETCSVRIPEGDHIKVMVRKNEGYDFGAWTDGLASIPDKDAYAYYLFINTSVRGPYLKSKDAIWQHAFTDMIQGDTKLVGTTINISTLSYDHVPLLRHWPLPHAHVQSQMFAMDRQCLMFLQDKVFVPHDPSHSFKDVIQIKEIGMSQWVIHHGWNINCLLEKYKGLDYRTIKEDINPTSRFGDPNYDGCYFGSTFTPYDVMFIKANRDLPVIESFSEVKHAGFQWNRVLLAFVYGLSIAAVLVFCMKRRR